MLKAEYLARPNVAAFCQWLALRLNGTPINFLHPGNGRAYVTLRSALDAYSWPNKSTRIDVPQTGIFTLPRQASFEDNEQILNRLQGGLRATYAAPAGDVASWVIGVMQWGGVYRGGNRDWLANNGIDLQASLAPVVANILALDDDFGGILNIRFNAAMTKVYSMLCDEFVIYDSRVAAALAWLATQCFGAAIPDEVQFRCLPAQGRAHNRNPRPEVFLMANGNAQLHAHWNARASWILSHALALSNNLQMDEAWTLRKIEAALFTLGFDVY